MATLKNKLRKKHFDTKFRKKKALDHLAAFDMEYAHNHDLNEILRGNEAYDEFLNEKKHGY